MFDVDFSSPCSTQSFGDHLGHGHAAVSACDAAASHQVSLLSEANAGRA
jgi:hypothetical protein